MVVTIQQFIKELKDDHLYHYISLYDGKAYTLAVYIENDFRIGISDGKEKEFGNWCDENCDGEWSVHNGCWVVFELDTDVMAFKLRWE